MTQHILALSLVLLLSSGAVMAAAGTEELTPAQQTLVSRVEKYLQESHASLSPSAQEGTFGMRGLETSRKMRTMLSNQIGEASLPEPVAQHLLDGLSALDQRHAQKVQDSQDVGRNPYPHEPFASNN